MSSTTSIVPQGIADNRSDDPSCDDHDITYQAQRMAHLARMWQTPFAAAVGTVSPPSPTDPWCLTCGGCTDRQDLEALQMGVACVCQEERER